MIRWALLFLLSLPVLASAATINLAWDYTQGSDLAVFFAVYRQTGCVGMGTRFVVDVSVQTLSDSGPFEVNTIYCYNVTAVDSAGQESTPSNTVAFQVQTSPKAPSNLRGTVVR